MAADTMKAQTAAARFDTVSKHLPQGRWLDVGCSSGQFVSCGRDRGIDCEGIDVSTVAVETRRSQGLPLHASAIEEWAPGTPCDAITCFDVIEHVLDPAAFLANTRRLLRSGGSIVMLDSA